MDRLLIQALLAAPASDSEDTVWVTALVFAVVGAAVALWSFVKKKPQIIEREDNYSYQYGGSGVEQQLTRTLNTKKISSIKNYFHKAAPVAELPSGKFSLTAAHSADPKVLLRKTADLKSGLEVLEMDFLLHVVGNTASGCDADVTMRKICFPELIRRKQLGSIGSAALRVYSLNKNNLFSKEIQAAALEELALRTAGKTKPHPAQSKSENAKVTV